MQEQKKGKHYAISDLHGRYDIYKNTINALDKEDTLYIIGDVIDRCPGGVEILNDIIKRQNNPEGPKIVFLLGNHEMSFMDCMRILAHFPLGCKREDVINAAVLGGLIKEQRKYENDSDKYREYEEEIKKYLEECQHIVDRYKKMYGEHDDLKIMDVIYNHFEILYLWLDQNGGTKTLKHFFNKDGLIDGNKANEIWNFLEQADLATCINIGDEIFLLVHAFPPQKESILKYILGAKSVKYNTNVIPDEEKIGMLQNREEDGWNYDEAIKAGLTTICGHTPSDTGDIIIRRKDGKTVCCNIDMGCFRNEEPGKEPRTAALFCLEDKKVRYVGKDRIYDEPPGLGEGR